MQKLMVQLAVETVPVEHAQLAIVEQLNLILILLLPVPRHQSGVKAVVNALPMLKVEEILMPNCMTPMEVTMLDCGKLIPKTGLLAVADMLLAVSLIITTVPRWSSDGEETHGNIGQHAVLADVAAKHDKLNLRTF